MEGLLLRLSMVDADAAAAVRVIAYFDALVEHRATLAQLVRAAAALAECPAGLVGPGIPPLRMRPDGAALVPGPPAVLSGAGTPGAVVPSGAGAPGADEFGADGAGGVASGVVASSVVELADRGRVWLERPGPPGPLDDLVLERFALSARLLGGLPHRTPAPGLADPALVELVLAEREAPEDRARALRLLGLDSVLPVRVVAVAAPGRDPGAEAVGLVARGRPVRSVRVAVIGELAAVLLQPRDGAETFVPDLRAALAQRTRERTPAAPAVRVGVGAAVPGLEARTSWSQARLAVRFAEPGDGALVDHGDLGAVALLAQVPAPVLAAAPDVAALNALAATASGALDVAALEAFCRTGSLRAAAAGLHLHHSSVAARIAHVEDALGWALDEPGGRFRARVALLARRLAGSG